jgi:hypothetical protein
MPSLTPRDLERQFYLGPSWSKEGCEYPQQSGLPEPGEKRLFDQPEFPLVQVGLCPVAILTEQMNGT